MLCNFFAGEAEVISITVMSNPDSAVAQLNTDMLKELQDKKIVIELRTSQGDYKVPVS
ncbi:hypothetical protein NST74_08265 [Paenibacillus sp. FSL F4-0125]|uniref:hypothetical protein n=1 Tax=Paenibacillus sp. FSL F4-0125 TaxID=2954730 RepID=UPI0030F99B70